MNIMETVKEYLDDQLDNASRMPNHARYFTDVALGGINLACRLLDKNHDYESSEALKDLWDNKYRILFSQLY